MILASSRRALGDREFSFPDREDAEAFLDIVTSINPDGLMSMRRLY